LYVDDNWTRIDRAYSRGTPGEIYNFGAGNEMTNLEIAKLILQKLGKSEQLISFVQDRHGHDFRYLISIEKIKKLDWSISCPFEEAMGKTIEWHSLNSWWWKPLLDFTPLKKVPKNI
jgi:dTDP-glucose 4,6-dehydratase